MRLYSNHAERLLDRAAPSHILPPCHPPADMLPRGVREKLLVIAQHIKKKHKEQQKAAAAAEGGGVRSKVRQVTQRLAS